MRIERVVLRVDEEYTRASVRNCASLRRVDQPNRRKEPRVNGRTKTIAETIDRSSNVGRVAAKCYNLECYLGGSLSESHAEVPRNSHTVTFRHYRVER